jgi:hypothetical protein
MDEAKTDLLLSNEITSKTQPLQIEFTGKAFPEVIEYTSRINNILLVVADAEHIIQPHLQTPFQVPVLDTSGKKFERYKLLETSVNHLDKLREEINFHNKLMKDVDESEINATKSTPEEIKAASPATNKAVIIQIDNPAEILFLSQYFDLFHHDLGTPLTSVKGFLQWAERQEQKGNDSSNSINYINNELKKLNETLEEAKELTKFRFPIDILSAEQNDAEQNNADKNIIEVVARNFRANLLSKIPSIKTEINLSKEFFEDNRPVWSYIWLAVTLKNMAQNADRAYRARDEMWDKDEIKKHWPKEKDRLVDVNASVISKDEITELKQKVHERYQFDPNKSYMALAIEDRATGFSDSSDGHNIARDGYRRGKGGYGDTEVTKESTATAMALISQISFERYGVIIVPENVYDNDGNIIGAKQTIYIPLAEES